MNSSIKFNDACFYKDYYYFSNLEFNSLFRTKDNLEETEFLGFFENESHVKPNIHNQVLLYKDKLYFIPLRGRGITIYDLITGDKNFIDLHCEEAMISCAFILEGWIYLIPMNNLEMILKINLKDNSVHENTQLRRVIEKFSDLYFCDIYGAALMNHILHMALYNTGKLLQINLLTYEYECFDFADAKFDNISCIKNDIWITSTEGAVLYEVKAGNIKRIKIGTAQETRQNFRICENQGCLYCLPCFGNSIFIKREHSDDWESMEKSMPKGFQREIKEDTLFMGTYKKECSLLLFPKSGNGIIEMKGDALSFRKIEVSQSELDGLMEQRKNYVWKESAILQESNDMSLKCFMSLI